MKTRLLKCWGIGAFLSVIAVASTVFWNAHTIGVDRNLFRASAIHHYLGNYQWAQRNRRLCAHGRTRELLLRIARVLGRGCVAETPFRKTGAKPEAQV
jgi:hypothetical protein